MSTSFLIDRFEKKIYMLEFRNFYCILNVIIEFFKRQKPISKFLEYFDNPKKVVDFINLDFDVNRLIEKGIENVGIEINKPPVIMLEKDIMILILDNNFKVNKQETIKYKEVYENIFEIAFYYPENIKNKTFNSITMYYFNNKFYFYYSNYNLIICDFLIEIDKNTLKRSELTVNSIKKINNELIKIVQTKISRNVDYYKKMLKEIFGVD